ncbi:MAG: excinuclease ABC subunit C, partial [Clostridiales bacterium 43-6]
MQENTNREKLKLVPKKPGVYIMRNVDNRVIYVGKAKILYNRLAQYFIGTPRDQKTMQMVSNVTNFEYIITKSEKDALILESNLIKKYNPKYNILLKDDKTYPFIKIDMKNEYPYLSLVRKTHKDSNKYYGPFLNANVVNEIIDIVSKEYQIRSCKFDLTRPKKRECLNYHIGYCSAPCTRLISSDAYKINLSCAIEALDGGLRQMLPKLKKSMLDFADALDFENAGMMRDKIKTIEKFAEKHRVVTVKKVDLDVVYFYYTQGITAVIIIEVRKGIINDKKSYTFLETDDIANDEIITSFLEQYYLIKNERTNRIVLGTNLEDTQIDFDVLRESLSIDGMRDVGISAGRGKFSKNLLLMAKENAIDAIKQRLETKIDDQLFLLKEKLNLYSVPTRIESYDISNTAGSNPVGVMTVFENGAVSKKDKRTFAIKGNNGSDDYASIYEVLDRRLRNFVDGTAGFEQRPDLIFLDGGKGQVKMGKSALANYELDIPLFGLVKDDKHRTKDITDGYKNYNVRENRELFTFVSKIQEETHKNAITYHKKKNTLTATQSELISIPKVGKQTVS